MQDMENRGKVEWGTWKLCTIFITNPANVRLP
jgi:hypothetical protein